MLLTGKQVCSLMRRHKVTIRDLAKRMNITMKRVRQVRAKGVTDSTLSALCFVEWISGDKITAGDAEFFHDEARMSKWIMKHLNAPVATQEKNMRITRTFTKTEYGRTYTGEAYSDDNGQTWRWTSNSQYCPDDACREYGIPCDFVAQEKARDEQVSKMLAAYRAAQPAVPSHEEMAEMRAAFGPGKDVVDVITGRKFRT